MDELEISGKRYISSRRAGKEHKYHPDYIGQLIRAKKVAGQKVGRSWYVDADALSAYLGKEVPPRGPRAAVEEVVETVEIIAAEEITPEDLHEIVEEVKAATVEEVVVDTTPVEIIEEEKINTAVVVEAEEEFQVPIKIVEPIQERVVEKIIDTPIPLRRSTLKYIVDAGPLFPEVKKQNPKEHMTSVMPTEEEVERVIITPRSEKKKVVSYMLVRGGALLVLGAVVFGVVVAGSFFVTSVVTLDGGQAASVGYTLK